MYTSLIRFDVVGVLFQDDDALEDASEGGVLVGGQLSAVPHAQQHWRRVCLEPCNRLGPPSLQQITLFQNSISY